MAKMGTEYEGFVARLQQALLNADAITTQKNILIETNKKIVDNCGIKREFDVYWEYELAGVTYKTVIECKDYKSNISVEKIDALVGKIKDIPDLKPLFATKKGYQSGAKTKAEKNKIDLLVVREQNDSDWVDKDGNQYLKGIDFNLHILNPAIITNFTPSVNSKWIEENTDINASEPIRMTGMSNEIFIYDDKAAEEYSLYDLAKRLEKLSEGRYGDLTHTEDFEDAYISFRNEKLKMDSYTVEYTLSKPSKTTFSIDFEQELIGVIEYLQKGTKKSIFRDGKIRDDRAFSL